MADDGYTKMNNWLIAALYRAEGLTFREVRVLLYIARKTLGFHKDADKIPFSQIAEATGIDIRDVKRAMKDLEEKKVISVRRKKNCVNIVRIIGVGKSPTTGVGKLPPYEWVNHPPSKYNQKSVTSGSHLSGCDPRDKKNIEREEEDGEYGYE